MKGVRRNRMQETVELNITAFLNLMVILVPFLLITAVFSRMTVLELTLPDLNAKSENNEKVDLQLQLVVRTDSYTLQDATLGVIRQLPRDENNPDWNSFTSVLIQIKSQFPEETSITLLFARDVKYRALIEVMDHVKTGSYINAGTLDTVELFPDVSIGAASEVSAVTDAMTTDEAVTDELNSTDAPQSEPVIDEGQEQ